MDDEPVPSPEEGAGSPAPSGDDGCTRRRVLNAFLASGAVATGGAVAFPIARFLLPPEQVEAAVASVVASDSKTGKPFQVSQFPVNHGESFRMGSQPGLLVRLQNGEFRAFSAKCTHLACLVQYRQDTKLIWCACHNGTYDLTGKNISGPPPRPLTPYTANVRGDEVVVSRSGA
jgi:Rieske Fe-S protein